MTATGPASIVLRGAGRHDVEAVARIERESFADPWSARSFGALLGRDEVLFDVATRTSDDSAVLGYTVLYVVVDEAELANVAVAKEARREGVGRRLLTHAMSRAVARGARELYLEVRVSNEAARTLYTALGFTEVGRRARYYNRPVEDALILRRTLA